MEAGTVRREIVPQQIDSVFSEVKELMQPLADKNLIRLEMHVTDPLPQINADGEELIRLFNNLVSNAIKYNKQDGNIQITAEQDGPYVRVSVTDTGIGISKEGLSQLFSEFFREKRKETKNIKTLRK